MRTKSKRQRRKVRVEKLKKKLSVFSTWISGRLERKREIENENEREREWEREREIEWENREREETIIVPDILLNCATTWYEHRSERKTEKGWEGSAFRQTERRAHVPPPISCFRVQMKVCYLFAAKKRSSKRYFFRWRGQDLSSLRVRLVRFSR
jgi:hypothetical protein